MKKHLILLLLIIIVPAFGYSQNLVKKKTNDIHGYSNYELSEIENQPDEIKAKLKWFQDLKLGVLICWSPAVVWGGPDSWSLTPDAKWARPDGWEPWVAANRDLDLYRKNYFELYKQFNPVKFDPVKWGELFNESGIKYVGITTKHHDGFCMWDTDETDYKITSENSPFYNNPDADIVKRVFEESRKNGLGVLCYFSKPDWNIPYYWSPKFPIKHRGINYNRLEHPDIWDKFKNFTYNQIEELMSDYGKVDILWLDGGQVRPPRMDIDIPRIAEMARSHQDSLIVVDRTVKGYYENYVTPEQHIPDSIFMPGKPWESCITVQTNGWYWRKEAKYRSKKDIIHMFIDVVSKGGNLMYGIGPNPDGEFDQPVIDRLNALGKFLKINGEAIYATIPWKNFTDKLNNQVRYTSSKDGQTVYVHLLEWPANNKLKLEDFLPQKKVQVTFLGQNKKLKWHITDEQFICELPEKKKIDKEKLSEYAWVLKIEF